MKSATLLVGLSCASAHTRSTFDASEFKLVGRAPAASLMTFTAALPMGDFAGLDKTLIDVSDPKSPNYGQWLSQEDVLARVNPDADIRAEVRTWLEGAGASCIDWPSSLRCTAPASAVETAFKTQVSQYTQSGKTLFRVAPTASFTYPAQLSGKLLFVTSVFDFPTKRMRMGPGILAISEKGKATSITPPSASLRGVTAPAPAVDLIVTLETVQRMYGLAGVMGSAASITAPAEFQNDDAITTKDIQAFATAMGIPAWTITSKIGPFAGSDTEATLDGQYIAGVGQGNTQFWLTQADWQYEFTQQLVAAPAANRSAVYSISWGWSEQDQCTVDPTGPCAGTGTSAAYVAATNQGFAAVGALGITILVSSGDSGAHGRTDGACTSKKTVPDWPASSPYILSVGATQLQAGGTPITGPTSPYCKAPTEGACAGGGVEVVAAPNTPVTPAEIASGGGFSVFAPAMAYQTAAVATYLASGALLPAAGDFNTTTRGYPDVSALGHNVLIYESGALIVDGTSCSAPMFGGVIGLANAARLAAGKAVLGFVNPAIYTVAASTPAAFNDVTMGNNICTEDGCKAGCSGFGAVKGWDAVSGWGSPNVPALIAALVKL